MLQRTSFQGVSLGEEHLATKDNNQTICCSTEAFLQNVAFLSKAPQKQIRDSAIFTTPLKKSLLESSNLPTPFKKISVLPK